MGNDSYGDGICCGQGEGSYAIKFDGVTAKEGAQFGSTDTYSFPAEATPGPTPPAGHVPFVLRVRTDNWGGETSWVVTSTAGNGQSHSGSGYDSYTLYTETIDLVDQGCHTRTATASFTVGTTYRTTENQLKVETWREISVGPRNIASVQIVKNLHHVK